MHWKGFMCRCVGNSRGLKTWYYLRELIQPNHHSSLCAWIFWKILVQPTRPDDAWHFLPCFKTVSIAFLWQDIERLSSIYMMFISDTKKWAKNRQFAHEMRYFGIGAAIGPLVGSKLGTRRSFAASTLEPWMRSKQEISGILLMVQKSEIRLTSWYGKYPIFLRVLYIPGGCLGFLPSTVW